MDTPIFQVTNIKQKHKPIIAEALRHFDNIAQTRKDIPSTMLMGSARNAMIEALYIAVAKEDDRIRTLIRVYGPDDQIDMSHLLQHIDLR